MGEPTDFYATKNWTAGIIGLGYVGLPLAITATNAGLPVIGLDTDAAYVDRLRAGLSPIEDVPDEQLAAAIAAIQEMIADGLVGL